MERQLLKKSKPRRLPPWATVIWGGFNAGAVLGLFDALLVMTLGLGTFEKMGAIIGVIFIDALGIGIIGALIAFAAFVVSHLIHKVRIRILEVCTALFLIAVSFCLTYMNIGWSLSPHKKVILKNPSNMLLLTLDTTRSDMVGFGGNPYVNTPVLDRLAKYGWQFCNAVCPVPMTTPSHASILTSTIPSVHGAQENRYRLGPDNETITEIFSENGYRTAAFVSCFPLDRRFGLDQGFDLYEDRFGVPGDLRQASWLKMLIRIQTRGLRERNYRFTNSVALPWIRKYSSDGPFFLWIHYFDPHSPYSPVKELKAYYKKAVSRPIPAKGKDQLQKASAAIGHEYSDEDLGVAERLYLGEVTGVDIAVGEILREFASKKLMDDLMIAVAADHGESFGEHGYFYTHGEDIYEPALAVPLVLWGSKFSSGRLNNELTCLTDIAPTVLTAAGISKGQQMEGFDLMHEMGNRKYALVENYGIIMASKALKQQGIRTQSYKYFHEKVAQKEYLFDLELDPGERKDVSKDQPVKLDILSSQTREGFSHANDRSHESDMDLSRETLEKLRALGYTVSEENPIQYDE